MNDAGIGLEPEKNSRRIGKTIRNKANGRLYKFSLIITMDNTE